MEISPIKDMFRIVLVGNYSPDIMTHRAIPLAIDDAAAILELVADYDWLTTPGINNSEDLTGHDVIWVVPSSPYYRLEGALVAIRYARKNSVPFLGACGGFQHTILEYARNVLGWSDAAHAGTDITDRMVIVPLTRPLVEETDDIELRANTLIAKVYGRDVITKGYHCNYDVSEDFVAKFESGDLRVVGWDEAGDIRVIELVTYPFYAGAFFQRERGALAGRPVPLVQAVLCAARE